MPIETGVPTLPQGAFFGHSLSSVSSQSFKFSELKAVIPERQVPKHTHETPHFILVTEGVYVTEARNQPGVCQAGSLIFNPGGTIHRDCFRSKKGKFVSISLNPEQSWLLSQASPASRLISDGGIPAPGGHEQIGDRITRELRAALPFSPAVLEGLGLELVALVMEIEERTISQAAPNWLLRVREMIRDGFDEEFRMEGLASCAGVHPVYLARAYRRHFGCSPGEYLRRCRLLQVRELLTSSDLSMVEIALQCGFSDQSQMTRLFSKTFGAPPARFRRVRNRETMAGN